MYVYEIIMGLANVTECAVYCTDWPPICGCEVHVLNTDVWMHRAPQYIARAVHCCSMSPCVLIAMLNVGNNWTTSIGSETWSEMSNSRYWFLHAANGGHWADTLWIASPAIQYPRCLERPRSRTWTCPAPVSTRTRPRAPRSCRRSGRRTTSSGASPPWPRPMQRTSMQPRKKRGKRKR